MQMTKDLQQKIATLARQSTHPLSKAIGEYFGRTSYSAITGFKETPGNGIEGIVDGDLISLGSKKFVLGNDETEEISAVYVSVEEQVIGRFTFKNHYRKDVPVLIKSLRKQYALSVLSGDNAGEKNFLSGLLGNGANILFHQKPEDKLEAVMRLQKH